MEEKHMIETLSEDIENLINKERSDINIITQELLDEKDKKRKINASEDYNKKAKVESGIIKHSDDYIKKLLDTPYLDWTKDEVFYLLCTERNKGGVGLSKEVSGLFCEGDFCGESIGSIIRNQPINLSEAITTISQKFPNVDQNSIMVVILWIGGLLISGNLKEKKSIIDINKGRIQQISALNNASTFMEFIGVEELGKTISKTLLTRFSNNTLQSTLDKTQVPIIVFATSPGTGKTRNAMEVINCAKQVCEDKSLQEYLDIRIELYLPMGRNGMGYGRYKSDYIKTPNYANRFFAIRLCYLFSTYYLQSEFNENDWVLDSVANFCSWLKDEYFASSKITIVVVIDEFQKLNENEYKYLEEVVDDTIRSGLDVTINTFGEVCTKCLTDILFVPIFSGLSFTPINRAIKQSTHPILHIQPIRLRMSMVDILQFLRNYLIRCTKQATNLGLSYSNLLTHPELSKCLNRCCGVPRLIEYMLNAMAFSGSNWQSIFNNIERGNP
ncbi:predicted protein [Naegleria gruberi]|uniref:Predicted protein n=1 Tax=Naegleria gruberi TaxID=5762 RepID=D2VHC3_NAEGR|nr:uncharacterized protein NAEGRDRAFT_49465 [Naegleria gruberi]EFC43862.1 predicted protein [Naegleria gruberi]|eukprot:XP_002676606.1 predicted protein [Naegleria gruberi strain NEG-M]